MLRAYGITEFHAQVEQVATARLKERPEDFVVVEVDTQGVRTDVAEYTFAATPATLTRQTNTSNTNNINATTSTVNGDSDRMVDSSRQLSAAVRDVLHAAFGSKGDAIARYTPAAEGKDCSQDTKELVIGVFNVKEERRQLHQAVKIAFPHLRTQTRHIPFTHGADDVCDHQVVASCDFDYLLLAHLLGEYVADSVEAWSCASPQTNSFHVTALFPEEATKAIRRAFHKMMERRHPGIICRVANGRVTLKGSPSKSRENQTLFDNLPGVFTHLIVRKRNLDMMELRAVLAEHFGVPNTSVCVAGLKDKCAITYQRCSVPGFREGEYQKQQRGGVCRLASPSDSSNYVEILKMSGPCALPVEIGQLNGNWFNLCLRKVQGMTRKDLAQRLQCVESKGFLNYFGQQRFSEHLTGVADHVGVHLLAGRWADAVRSLLCGAPGLYESFTEKMEIRHVPAGLRDARCIVQALHRLLRTQYASMVPPLSQDDVMFSTSRWQKLCHSALLVIPFTFRVLWVHAAQSLIFNLMLSKLSRVNSIFAVVHTLPLLGHQVTVEDVLRPILEQTLSELNLRLDDVRQKKVVGVPLPGGMRPTVARPVGCSLVFDDGERQEDGDEGGAFTARLSFFLPPSSYATIFLREVLGCDEAW